MNDWKHFGLDWPDEHTDYTAGAFAYAKRVATETFTAPSFADDGSELRVLPDGPVSEYVASVMGQFPATRGLQGANEKRLQYLRELGVPVFLIYIQGSGRENATSVWTGWLHELPTPQRISRATGNKRFGWRVSPDYHELVKTPELTFPPGVPDAENVGLF